MNSHTRIIVFALLPFIIEQQSPATMALRGGGVDETRILTVFTNLFTANFTVTPPPIPGISNATGTLLFSPAAGTYPSFTTPTAFPGVTVVPTTPTIATFPFGPFVPPEIPGVFTGPFVPGAQPSPFIPTDPAGTYTFGPFTIPNVFTDFPGFPGFASNP
jgi:hypothetical protein